MPSIKEYDLPPSGSQWRLRQLGVRNLDDMRLTQDVSASVVMAFRDLELYVKPGCETILYSARCDSLKQRFIGYIQASIKGNPYPGAYYSVALAKDLILEAEKSVWTAETILSEVQRLKEIFQASLAD